MSGETPGWLVALVREFGPKIVPLDVTPEGTYEEATTRWGINPIYEAVPEEIRDAVEPELNETVRHELAWYRQRGS